LAAKIDRVVLGHPVAFVRTEGPQFEELQALAIARLGQAAEKAGFAEIEFLPEPAAAVQDELTPEGVVVALDFGGGTFDVAVVEFSAERADVLALQGAAVGGNVSINSCSTRSSDPSSACSTSTATKRGRCSD
jgi:hypothetical chaperone protein